MMSGWFYEQVQLLNIWEIISLKRNLSFRLVFSIVLFIMLNRQNQIDGQTNLNLKMFAKLWVKGLPSCNFFFSTPALNFFWLQFQRIRIFFLWKSSQKQSFLKVFEIFDGLSSSEITFSLFVFEWKKKNHLQCWILF